MSTHGHGQSDVTVLRGREAELATLARHLRGAADGRSSVVVIEGGRGSGKSRLLGEAQEIAAREGFGIGCGVAVQGDDAVTMGPLLGALLDGPKPLLDRRSVADTSSAVDRELAVHHLEAPLEQAARRRPVLICLDDLHWADRSTAAALRVLPTRLGDLPIMWVIAFRSSAAFPALADLTANLRRGGAEMLSLAPLEDSASIQIVADIAGAEPSPELSRLASSAGGDPSLLVALVRGLSEEGLIRQGRHAELVEDRIPQRLGDMTRERLTPLSSLARQAATVASVLGKAVSFDHVAAMLSVSPASLLGPIEELVGADVLVTTGGRIAFHNDLLRRSVIETAPESVSQALDRQAIDVMVAAGAPPIEPAMRLATTAQVGDRASISTLTTASRALASSSPAIAAELGRRALDLSPAGDPRRATLVADVALLLHDAGRAGDGKAMADQALLDRLAPEHEAEIRLSVAAMYEISPELRVGAGSAALALPELPGVLRARHLSALVLSVLCSGRLDVARQLIPRAETAVAHACDTTATQAIEHADMYAAYMDGTFAEAVRRIDGGLGAIRRSDGRRAREIDILRAEALLATDEFEAAHLAAVQASADAKRDHQGSLETAWQRFIGRHHLQSGRLAEANEVFDHLFASEVVGSFENVGLAAAMVASGRVAIHLGDARRAKNVARVATNTLSSGSPELRRHAAWFLALYAMSCHDDGALQVQLETLRDEAIAPGFPLLMVDVADLPQLVRIALEAGADDVAGSVADAARQRHRANPEVRSIAGIAAHASGLVDRDHMALESATKLLAGGPRPLAAAAAFEDLGVDAVLRGNRASGLEALGNALQLYSATGATWDESRIRLRLRELGVRRRLVKAARPTNGWKALTDAELAVVRLVAEGLTNRAIAERLYVSPHTVSMHLRHVFTKLGIRSRVELTRMAFEGDQAA